MTGQRNPKCLRLVDPPETVKTTIKFVVNGIPCEADMTYRVVERDPFRGHGPAPTAPRRRRRHVPERGE